MKTALQNCMTFAAAVAVGCGAAIAIASTAAVSQAAPTLRTPVRTTPVEVVRLEPVVVTVSRSTFDAVRKESAATELARTNDVRKVTRG